MKDWSLTMYGTETEPGQEVPPLAGEQHHSQNDPAMHHVVDTTEGKTETRDPGTHLSSYPSSSSSALRLAVTTPQAVPLEKVLPVGCLRSSAVGACLECKKDLYIFNGQCLKKCSPGHYAWDPLHEGVTGVPSCHSCHYSCYSCSGPQDYECTKCWGDAEMYSLSKDLKLCQPRSLLDSYRRQEGWYLALVGVVVGLVVLVMVLGVMVLRRSRGSHHKQSLPKTLTGFVKPATNGKIGYSPMPQESSDTLITSIPFHDLTTDEEEENDI